MTKITKTSADRSVRALAVESVKVSTDELVETSAVESVKTPDDKLVEASAVEERMFSVSQVSKLTGATLKQLKDWDKNGFFVAQRTGEGVANNRKIYTAADIDQIRDILLLKKLGLELKEIREILDTPEEKREEVLSKYADRMREEFGRLQRRVQLSSVASTLGIDQVKQDASLITNYDLLADGYEKDEMLKAMLRWLKSHTDRDVMQFSEELTETAEEFAALKDNPSWDALELQIARFCDMWDKRFSWPAAGQMLTLYAAFSENPDTTLEIDSILGDGITEFIADVFFLGWVSAALECLDDIFAHLYKAELDNAVDNTDFNTRNNAAFGACNFDVSFTSIQEAAQTLVAFVCEFGTHPQLHDAPPDQKRTDHILRLSEMVFSLLEEAVLDPRIEDFLQLEDFPSADGPALDFAQNIIEAQVRGKLKGWFRSKGSTLLKRRTQEWAGYLEEEWKWQMLQLEQSQQTQECRKKREQQDQQCQQEQQNQQRNLKQDKQQNQQFQQEQSKQPEQGKQERQDKQQDFYSWLNEWFDEYYPDAPEATWAADEESWAKEKLNREIIQESLE